MEREFISRKLKLSDDVEKTELIRNHLREVAEYSGKCSEKFGLPTIGFLVGLLHDFGKYSDIFQERIREDLDNGAIHSQQGAKFILEQNACVLLKEIIAQTIFAHHGGLLDGADSDGERPMYSKLFNNEKKLEYEIAKERFLNEFSEVDFNELLEISEKEFGEFFLKIYRDKKLQKDFFFYLNLITKAIYSGLVDADRTCAYLFGVNRERKYQTPKRIWNTLIPKLENYLSKYTTENKLDRMRKKISNQCFEKGKTTSTGIYQLSVPTGGGKTLSSLRFAINHAKRMEKDHIIYIVPYLSVLDQTAKSIKEALDYQEDYILEHHSNVLRPENKKDNDNYRLLTSSWDAPIILTTMVQFLETIYSNKGTDLRKFHNMANSVLIFDEVQALPVKCTHLFNLAINFLNQIANSTILLCTATQPILDKVKRPIVLSEYPDLVELSEEEQEIFRRTEIVDQTAIPYTPASLAEFIEKQVGEKKNTLAIFNTKTQAESVFKETQKYTSSKVFFLSTSLCPAHRMNVLEQVKKNLKESDTPIVLISTQLVEAGVDVSFECVIRAKAGLDNIVQAAGRCNRSGEFEGTREVFVITMKGENLSRLPEIESGKDGCSRIFREKKGKDFLSKECLEQYYNYYFFGHEEDNELDYLLPGTDKGKTIYRLLSDNPEKCKAYKDITRQKFEGLPSAFKEASDNFFVIDKNQFSVVVPYNEEAEKLIYNYEKLSANDFSKKKAVLRKLQRYSVSLHECILKKLEKEHAIWVVNEGFYSIDKSNYNDELGVISDKNVEN
ncbi:MAG: CRISPR-associated helicase Cas3' [Lactobacillales bacterium]|jgi:CRISPR-associated endonuclease/helicase Cas3|nr:CRISPR-associated helicase Cas3' [Lactobacillales bacterium]